MHPERATTGTPDDPAGADALTFPDQPRLELDELLAQVVERAQGVMAVQGRLRGLLAANQLITSDLALPAVLRHITEAARELIGARYAAVGVVVADGFLAEFVHTGMSAATVARIGRLPQGKGLLGALIEDPVPIRLRHLAADPRSSGVPDGHPPMDSFLGVPIRIRDQVYGHLYLTDSTSGEFSTADEDLARALAATAAVAIDNARLYETSGMRHAWLLASAEVTRELLSVGAEHDRDGGGDGTGAGGALHLIARHVHDIADADLVMVVLPGSDDDMLRVGVAVGRGADAVTGTRVPLTGSLPGRVFISGLPVRVSSPDEQPGLVSGASEDFDIGPMLVMPLVGPKRTHGVLVAARLRGRTDFTPTDLDMAAAFANQASLAVELAEARAEQERVVMLDEHDRIAADLHDHVVQRLFAAGLSLQSVAAILGPGRATDRVLGTIRDLDDTISQIRTTIFQLHRVPGEEPRGVRARLLTVVSDVAPALGFTPTVRFSGLLEDTLGGDVVDDLLAVLREALTNVARHADAHAAWVDLTAEPTQLALDVRDDGIGISPGGRRSGLANLQRRADHHSGTLTVERRTPTGSHLCWAIPRT